MEKQFIRFTVAIEGFTNAIKQVDKGMLEFGLAVDKFTIQLRMRRWTSVVIATVSGLIMLSMIAAKM